MTMAVGILFMITSIIGVWQDWRLNEWRQPLVYATGILKSEKDKDYADFYSAWRRRGTMLGIFLLVLYAIGATLVLAEFRAWWVIAVEVLVFAWLVKGVIGCLKGAYSKKVRLLNYLYSPYLLAWRRDRWSRYTDREVANALCVASGIDLEALGVREGTLDDFLIALCRHTRPTHEAQVYPNVLHELRAEANTMAPSR